MKDWLHSLDGDGVIATDALRLGQSARDEEHYTRIGLGERAIELHDACIRV